MQYKDYLKTAHWLNVKKAALRLAGGKCQICGSPKDLGVHHNNYASLWCESAADTIVLCRRCHAKHHGQLPQEPERVLGSARDYYFWPVIRDRNGSVFHSRRLKPEFDALYES